MVEEPFTANDEKLAEAAYQAYLEAQNSSGSREQHVTFKAGFKAARPGKGPMTNWVIKPRAIHRTNEGEVHLLGDYVFVIWRFRLEQGSIRGEDGKDYEAWLPKFTGEPAISLSIVAIPDEGTDGLSANGELNAEQADQVAAELMVASRYLRKLQAEIARDEQPQPGS